MTRRNHRAACHPYPQPPRGIGIDPDRAWQVDEGSIGNLLTEEA
jgi:hypothetical protein